MAGVKFKVGDLVELLSGGPVMTVADVQDSIGPTVITTQWFSGRKLEVGHFAPEVLKRSVPKPANDKMQP